MKNHLIAAIVVGVFILAVSFLPVILAYNKYGLENLGHSYIFHVFVYPTVGVVVVGIIVFVSFFKE